MAWNYRARLRPVHLLTYDPTTRWRVSLKVNPWRLPYVQWIGADRCSTSPGTCFSKFGVVSNEPLPSRSLWSMLSCLLSPGLRSFRIIRGPWSVYVAKAGSYRPGSKNRDVYQLFSPSLLTTSFHKWKKKRLLTSTLITNRPFCCRFDNVISSAHCSCRGLSPDKCPSNVSSQPLEHRMWLALLEISLPPNVFKVNARWDEECRDTPGHQWPWGWMDG